MRVVVILAIIATAPPLAIAEPPTSESRLVVGGDGSVGRYGDSTVVGATLLLRYRPVELGLAMLDFDRKTVAPQSDDHRPFGIGLTALGRIPLGDTRLDAIVGGTYGVVLIGSDNPEANALYQGFAGIAYQTPWRLFGKAQPFVQLRGGASRTDGETSSFLELHLGLTSPERR